MAHINLMNLYKDRFQDIQDFRDHYIAMRKVCSELGPSFGRCEEDTWAVVKKEGVTDLSN